MPTSSYRIGRSRLLTLALVFGSLLPAVAQVGIGTTSPAASAALDVTSTTKGVLPPRLTLAQRNAISSPATGLTLYNTTTGKLNTWNGTSWQEVLSGLDQTNYPASVTFAYTGAVQTYTVPLGVTSLQVEARGAQGAPNSNQPSGRGALVQTTLAVTAGQVLYLYVGGAGNFNQAGYNGGGTGRSIGAGGGGGASDVRTSASGAAYTDRLVVAGGGGAGSNSRAGGGGGAPNGAPGVGFGGGAGGTLTSGNALGQGGSNSTGTHSGGGGGGYWGGGFGADGGGGGGGGSSFVTATGSSGTTMTAAVQTGNGSIVLTPGLQSLPPAPVLSGANFVNVPGDNLGNHTATQNLNLTDKLLVGNGGTAGLAVGSAGGVGIGTGTGGPVASAQLEVASTTKGFLPPRLSQTQRNAISSPAAGLVVYNTTTNKLNTWNGTTWDAALSATEQPTLSASTTFTYTGSPRTYTVPAGVTKLVVDVIGARGGEYISSGGGWRVFAGPGARVQSILTVTPGEVLTINVGQAGYSSTTQNARTYNGGGASGGGGPYPKSSGGGASDIRRGGTALANRVVVAGGGGGGGLESNSGGAGGTPNGGSPGLNAGGGAVGGPGGSGGAGGTPLAGNAGGSAGTLGQGGDGDPSWSTGGGGGGYWGGGGGGGQGAGGGGGSSWVDPALGSNISYSLAPGGSYNGQVVLTPAPVYVAPALDGSNFVNVPGDNLGNHTATQALNLGTNQLVGNGGTSGLSISSTGALTVSDLAGTTTRMVTTTAAGTLATAPLPVDTDAQQLSKSGSTISLTNGGSVTDADNQSLTLSGASLNISGGTGITLPDASATNELQSLSKTGSTVTLSNGGGSFSDTDAQQLSISGQTLSISGGNSVTLPAAAGDNLGNHSATQNLNLNSTYDLLLRDVNHGLGYYGTGKLWNGVNVDGPALYGFNAGLLGTNQGGTRTTALYWNTAGRVGIGTTDPQAPLHIDGPESSSATALGVLLGGGRDGNPSIELRGNGKVPYIDFSQTSGVDYTVRLIAIGGRMNVEGAGSTGILFDVNGGLECTGLNNVSDRRLKQHIRPLTRGLAGVLALRGVRYDWNPLGVQRGGVAGAEQIGLIAQEVEAIFPELVNTGPDGFKSVNYVQMAPVFIEAFKEQQAQIEALKAENGHLKAQATTQQAHNTQTTAILESLADRLRALEAGQGQARK